jgi:3',5'-nucleoside bisphosphate phosphatase
MIAICDHNSARNISAVQDAAEGRLAVLAGIELTSREEVHVVALFGSPESAQAVGDRIREVLPEAPAEYTEFFGEQMVLSADGSAAATEEAALALATSLELSALVSLVKKHGGIAVAAHVDRPAFGVLSQLGFFPQEAGFDAIEVSRHMKPGWSRAQEVARLGLPLLLSSDAHYVDEIGAAWTELLVEDASFDELQRALRGTGGRQVLPVVAPVAATTSGAAPQGGTGGVATAESEGHHA